MTDLAAISFSIVVVICASLAAGAFCLWLRQRERERLSSTDKAELTRRFEDLDRKLLELKNTVANIGRR